MGLIRFNDATTGSAIREKLDEIAEAAFGPLQRSPVELAGSYCPRSGYPGNGCLTVVVDVYDRSVQILTDDEALTASEDGSRHLARAIALAAIASDLDSPSSRLRRHYLSDRPRRRRVGSNRPVGNVMRPNHYYSLGDPMPA